MDTHYSRPRSSIVVYSGLIEATVTQHGFAAIAAACIKISSGFHMPCFCSLLLPWTATQYTSKTVSRLHEPHEMGHTDSHQKCNNGMILQFFFGNFKQQMKSNEKFFFEFFSTLFDQNPPKNPKNPGPKNPGIPPKP